MSGICSNIIIRECCINAGPNISNNSFGFGYTNGYPVDVRLVANTLTGGSANIYFNSFTASPANSCIYIDSNVLKNAFLGGLNTGNQMRYPPRVNSISHNIILNNSNSNADFYGLKLNDLICERVEGNRIDVTRNNDKTVYGIHISTISSSKSSCYICNNEIRVTGSKIVYGISLNAAANTMAEIHHNSVLSKSTNGTAYGLYIFSNNAQLMYQYNRVSRNIFIAKGSTNYPLYINNMSFFRPVPTVMFQVNRECP